MAPYGPPTAVRGAASPIMLVQALDRVPLEYAAIRTHAAIFDQPHRATLVVTGPDRLDFLNRMVTQELKGFETWTVRRSFWLNRKGRIDGDLRLINLPDRVLVDLDIHAAARTLEGLRGYVITEDCQIADETDRWHRFGLHGPGAARLLGSDTSLGLADLKPGQARAVRIAGADTILDRQDITGEPGFELLVPVEHAAAVYEALSAPWPSDHDAANPPPDRARRIGWHALNIARIEAGTAMYMLDFGPDSLPHETGAETMNDRVSFKKGCYLGQEVVARLQSLGHPKQRLVGLRMDSLPGPDSPQAETGAPLLPADDTAAVAIGAITSSCVSPMLGDKPVAFAMVKWSHATEGAKVWVNVGERRLAAAVSESLVFWPR